MKKQGLLGCVGATVCLLQVGCLSQRTEIQEVEGLVAYYKFDGNVEDSSPFRNDGMSCKVSFGTNRLGQAASAGVFCGPGSFVVVKPSESLHLTNGLSFAVWVNVQGYKNDWAPILCKGASREAREYAFALSHLVKGFYQDENNDTYRNCIGTHVTKYPRNDEWHHLVMSYDGCSTSAYMDGELVGQEKNACPSYLSKSGTEPLFIGMDLPGATENFVGLMDDLRIYNRPISAEEAKRLFLLKEID